MSSNHLNQKTYHDQIIKEQLYLNNKLWIVTQDKIGKYTLWCNNKKIAENESASELHNKIK